MTDFTRMLAPRAFRIDIAAGEAASLDWRPTRRNRGYRSTPRCSADLLWPQTGLRSSSVFAPQPCSCRRQRHTHFGNGGGLGAIGADEHCGLLDQGAVGLAGAKRCILKPNADVTPKLNRLGTERANVDAKSGDHPWRAARRILQECEVRGKRVGLGWKAVGEGVRKHEPEDRCLGARGTRQGCTGAGEPRLVNGVGWMEAIAGGKGKSMAHVRLGIEVRACRHSVGPGRELREIDAARV